MKLPISFVVTPLLALTMTAFTLASLILAGAVFLKPMLWIAILLGFVYLLPCTFLAIFDQADNDLQECATELGARWAVKGRDPRLEYFYIACASISLLTAFASFGSVFYAQILCHTSRCMATKVVMPVLAALPLFPSGAEYLLMRKKNRLASRLSQISLGIFLSGLAISISPFLDLTLD